MLLGQQTTQGGQPRPVFRTGVEVVQVDVVVTDKDGHAVRGLSREDFTVLDRKQPRAIVNFEEISHTYDAGSDPEPLASAPHDVATNTTPRASRLVVLLIDDFVPDDRLEKIAQVAKEVVTSLGQDASLALLTRTYARTVEVTEDQTSVLREIDKISSRSAESPKVARTKRAETTPCPWLVFRQVADMLRTDDSQRKAIVYISPFCGGGLKELVQAMEDGTRGPGGDDAIAAIEALRRANVAFYAIDPRGPEDYSLGNFDAPDIVATQGPRSAEAWRTQCVTRMCDPVLQSQDNQRAFSAATGGFAVTNTNDIPAGISQILDDFGHYYLLGFEASDFNERGYRPVEIAVNRPGLTLRYRRGYELGTAPTLRSTKDPMVAMSTGVLPRTDLPLRLLAVPRPSAGKTTPVAVALQVGDLPVPPAGAWHESVDITVLAANLENSKVVGEFLRPRQVVLARRPGGAAQEPLDYQVVTTVDLPPGKYQLRVSAKSATLDKGGSVYETIDVPDYAKTPLSVGALVLGYADPQQHSVSATLLDPGSLPFEPVLDRVFARTDVLRLFSQIWRRDGGATGTATRVELLDAQGQVVATFDGQPKGSWQVANLDIDLVLASLARGAYQLRVTATDGVHTDSRSIGLAIK
jgi:VWFA-related protein